MLDKIFTSDISHRIGVWKTAKPTGDSNNEKSVLVTDECIPGGEGSGKGNFFNLRYLAQHCGMERFVKGGKTSGNSNLSPGKGTVKPDIFALKSEISDLGFKIYNSKLDERDQKTINEIWAQLIGKVEEYLQCAESFGPEGSVIPLFSLRTNNPDINIMSIHIADSSSPEENLSRSYIHQNDNGCVSFMQISDEKSGKINDVFVWSEGGKTYFTAVGVRIRRELSEIKRDLVINVFEESCGKIKRAKGMFSINIGAKLGIKSSDGQGLILKSEEIDTNGFALDKNNGSIIINGEHTLVLKDGKYMLESRGANGVVQDENSFFIAQ